MSIRCELSSRLITYAQNGHFVLARSTFDVMQQKNALTWGVLLKMYGDNGFLENLLEMFNISPQWNVILCNILLSAYAQSGQVFKAREIFHAMPYKSLVSWNTLLSRECFPQVEIMYHKMSVYDLVSWNAMLAAYASIGHLSKVEDLFSRMPAKDSVSFNTVLAALGDRGLVNDAKSLFDRMTTRDIVSWTCLLQANTSREEFLAIHEKMAAWNSVSNLATLQNYIQTGELSAAKNTFDSLAEIRSVAAWTAMVGGYGDSGDLGAATAVFHKMPQWSIVSWTALLRANARESAAAAREIFLAMPGRNIASWNAMLTASAESFESSDLLLHQMPAWDLITLTAAVATFSQAGHIDRARVFFDAMPEKDPASWNAMVAAYGRRPGGAAALDLFHEMLLQGVAPDAATIKSVLAALSHGGDSRAACCCFASIAGGDFAGTIDSPGHDHYSCVIDVLGRCGRLGDAQELLEAMPFLGDGAARVSLIAACRTHEDVARGTMVAMDLLGIDENSSSSSWLSLVANMVKP